MFFTWGSTINYHPHIHCFVLGGGLDKSNHWTDCGDKFFLPVKVLSRKLCGKYFEEMMEHWEAGKLKFYGSSEKYRNHYTFKEHLSNCYEKEWIPHSKKTFNGYQPLNHSDHDQESHSVNSVVSLLM